MSTLVGYRSRTIEEPPAVERREPVVWGDRTGPLDAVDLERYEADGYLDVEDLLDGDAVARVSRAVDELLADRDLAGDERVVIEPTTGEARSIFDVHHLSDVIATLAASPQLVDPARQILGSDVYVHQSRVNLKQGLRGESFYWHSDFETWHMEDGMPAMRALSVSLNLTDNLPYNGSLMIIPTSHLTFIGCRGETPDEHYRQSLRARRSTESRVTRRSPHSWRHTASASWRDPPGRPCSSTRTPSTVPTATSRRSHGATCSSSTTRSATHCASRSQARHPVPNSSRRGASNRSAEPDVTWRSSGQLCLSSAHHG